MDENLLWSFSMKLPSLGQLLAYTNPLVIADFAHKNKISETDASALFSDLLAWMWLSVYRSQQGKLTRLFGPLLRLDDMWHCFILHTRAYNLFCETHFGAYFHHDVENAEEPHQMQPAELEDFLQDCFNFLSESWVDRYFAALFESANH